MARARSSASRPASGATLAPATGEEPPLPGGDFDGDLDALVARSLRERARPRARRGRAARAPVRQRGARRRALGARAARARRTGRLGRGRLGGRRARAPPPSRTCSTAARARRSTNPARARRRGAGRRRMADAARLERGAARRASSRGRARAARGGSRLREELRIVSEIVAAAARARSAPTRAHGRGDARRAPARLLGAGAAPRSRRPRRADSRSRSCAGDGRGGRDGAARCAARARVPVVPFGGGSGVCGGVLPASRTRSCSRRARHERLLALDDARSHRARVRAGMMGSAAEAALEGARLTIGHFPQSIDLSTVGGWVATRAAGPVLDRATATIEDLLLALEVVLPDGAIVRTRATPRACGRARPAPALPRQRGHARRRHRGDRSRCARCPRSRGLARFHFASFDDGPRGDPPRSCARAGGRRSCGSTTSTSRSGTSDERPDERRRCCLLVVHEGPSALGRRRDRRRARAARRRGREHATDAAAGRALARAPQPRAELPRASSRTASCSTRSRSRPTWDRVGALYARGDRVAPRRCRTCSSASAHSSHSYRSGTNLYFTFVARPTDRGRMRRDLPRVLAAHDGGDARRAAATIAHHHGIGRVRRDALAGELGAGGRRAAAHA